MRERAHFGGVPSTQCPKELLGKPGLTWSKPFCRKRSWRHPPGPSPTGHLPSPPLWQQHTSFIKRETRARALFAPPQHLASLPPT
ncbi:hypothetical protein N656DRAFT_272780 [Canariomyces notabilis]|uniref:Uncharacterized protein n=1 Tax=Canariomyces notabilis TaxID=2074819 RepID=A0AAN6TMM4_9PEZI|nr:hypothetical protein N656DRAFT_272780 [Canariomyces arenarius]